MARKRKRAVSAIAQADTEAKRPKLATSLDKKIQYHTSAFGQFPAAVLHVYYSQVISLRQFLLSKLPASSTSRRRLLSGLGCESPHHYGTDNFFNSTLVGVLKEPQELIQEARKRDFANFTQASQRAASGTKGSTQSYQIEEIVDFAIWALFSRATCGAQRPHHLLCYGYQRSETRDSRYQEPLQACLIPGLVAQYPNENVQALKQAPWPEILSLLGKNGDVIMQGLLLDCAIFVKINSGKENYFQLSGIPIADLRPIGKPQARTPNDSRTLNCTSEVHAVKCHMPGKIILVRNRMFYGRPALDAQGKVRFGLNHIHVFNRYSDYTSHEDIVQNLRYIFPRQFGLHNVFTSDVERKETVQPFKDYTLREHEISELQNSTLAHPVHLAAKSDPSKLPRRLRGGALNLMQRILKNHASCPYKQLLRFYCAASTCDTNLGEYPLPLRSQPSSPTSYTPLTQRTPVGMSEVVQSNSIAISHSEVGSSPATVFSIPAVNVSAFCLAVVQRLLPGNTFGIGRAGAHNFATLLASICRFVRARRFESLSLHEVCQGIRIHSISWLCPPNISLSAKTSASDREKRQELLLEFVYYLFDSLLIPLIRASFYVTESNIHKNQLLFFRHDVWRRISKPALAAIKLKMFSGVKRSPARNHSKPRTLCASKVRLLPKATGFRPIVNLRRRELKTTNGSKSLRPSINAQLMPIFDTLNYERLRQPEKLGSALFSIGDLHEKLRLFKDQLGSLEDRQLYFVKIDVRSCFDTIPQEQLMDMVRNLISTESYQYVRHGELQSGGHLTSNAFKVLRKYVSTASPVDASKGFSYAIATNLARRRKRTIFTETGTHTVRSSLQMLKLLQEHVQENAVRIGKKEFRQVTGIPQGSVLSTLLCSFFYGAFESENLGFLRPDESLLLRLIDDFLLITVNQEHAQQFLDIMAKGNISYGISVNARKSLANFETRSLTSHLNRHHGSDTFPYCGMLINMRTLEVSKDRERQNFLLSSALTVECSRAVGVTFHRKVLSSLKIQLHAMLLDCALNNCSSVARTLYQCFLEVAMKMHSYLRGLPKMKRPHSALVWRTISDISRLAISLTTGGRETRAGTKYECGVTKAQIQGLAATAFEKIFRQKQTFYGDVLNVLVLCRRRYGSTWKPNVGSWTELTLEAEGSFAEYIF